MVDYTFKIISFLYFDFTTATLEVKNRTVAGVLTYTSARISKKVKHAGQVK